jgi:hypothetical protein
MKNGLQIKADIETFDGDVEKITAYCMAIRNESMALPPTVEEYQGGNIRYFKSCGLEPFPFPSDELIGMWRDLFRKQEGALGMEDPLQGSERELFAMLTEKLKWSLSITSVEYNEITKEEKLPPNIRQPKPYTVR